MVYLIKSLGFLVEKKERGIGESIMDDGSLMWRQNEFSGCFLKALVGGSPSRGKPALAHLGGGSAFSSEP